MVRKAHSNALLTSASLWDRAEEKPRRMAFRTRPQILEGGPQELIERDRRCVRIVVVAEAHQRDWVGIEAG